MEAGGARHAEALGLGGGGWGWAGGGDGVRQVEAMELGRWWRWGSAGGGDGAVQRRRVGRAKMFKRDVRSQLD